MKSVTLRKIVEATGATLVKPCDIEMLLTGAAPLETAEKGNVSFLSNPKYASVAKASSASAIITGKEIDNSSAVQLLCPNPYLAWAKVCEIFSVDRSDECKPGTQTSAIIDTSASVHPSAHIGANVFVGARTTIGEGCIIHAGAVIEEDCQIGNSTEIHPNAVVHYRTRIGKNCVIWSNTVIGSYGFGFAMDGNRFVRIHQLGNVVLEDDVDIGAGTTIDRGAAGDTIIRRGTKIDNLVQIAHNVQIGEDSAIAAQAGLSGSLKIGNRVKIGGQAGFVGHIEIGDDSFVGAKAGVAKGFPAKSNITGYPARDFMEQRRLEAALTKMPELLKRVDALEKLLKEKE